MTGSNTLKEAELIAQQVSSPAERISVLEKRLDEVEKVNARLEQATLTTARAPCRKSRGIGTRSTRRCAAKKSPPDEEEPSAESRWGGEQARASRPRVTGHQALLQRVGGPGRVSLVNQA